MLSIMNNKRQIPTPHIPQMGPTQPHPVRALPPPALSSTPVLSGPTSSPSSTSKTATFHAASTNANPLSPTPRQLRLIFSTWVFLSRESGRFFRLLIRGLLSWLPIWAAQWCSGKTHLSVWFSFCVLQIIIFRELPKWWTLCLLWGPVGGLEFHEFPSLDRLAMVSEQELREAGFGYRAEYLTGTVKALQSKPRGGEEWLLSLRKLGLEEVSDALTTLPGVGPKVAACIALFSLDQHDVIPVDTLVWKIATRHLITELAGAWLTPKLCSCVAEAFVSKYGKYAGWAQTLLFVAELPSQKALLPPHFSNAKQSKSEKGKGRRVQTLADASNSE